MKKIKVLVTDDSIFMRKFITDMLCGYSSIEVVGTAKNGLEAIQKTKELSPDVVTLDVEMPVMNGLDALKEMMGSSPVPVIMLSSTTSEGSLNTILAMELGAVDFVAKPSGAISFDLYKVKEELIDKIRLAASSNIHSLTKRTKELKTFVPYKKENCRRSLAVAKACQDNFLVCIGASTGGPRALQTLLSAIPKTINAPIFIVQHMPRPFTKSLAERLDSLCTISVTEAENSQIVHKGTAYIAPGGFHMEVVKKGRELMISLTDSPPIKGHRPSVDVLFTSVSKLDNFHKVAVILTGMGADGSLGIMKMKKEGSTVAIAESEETSVVFGMPNAAIQTGLVDEVQNLENISKKIQQYLLS